MSRRKNPNAWYGWRPDKPDHRDFAFRPRRAPATLPDLVDLRATDALKAMPCYDQGELGSCTANAIAAALEFDQRKQANKNPITPSRLFIYYNERVMEGSVNEDAGAEIRDGIKSVVKLGAPDEKIWPYKVSKFKNKPTKRAYSSALAHQALIYERVQGNLQSMLECLASGFPFVFGFTCYESFGSDEVAKTGVLNMPEKSERMDGGHAVLCVGYQKLSQRFLVRNSWNTDWGIDGYFSMPFEYLTRSDLADDFWVIRTVE